MVSRKTRVIVAVSDYWLVGHLDLRGYRVQEVLNNHSTEFICLTDVRIASPGETECMATSAEMLVPKSKAEFVIVPHSQHEAPDKRFNNFATRATADAFAIVGGCSIGGNLHLPAATYESLHALANQLGRFFPVTNVSIRSRNAKCVCAPLLFANKEFVNCLCVGESAKHAWIEEQRRPLPDARDCSEESLAGRLEDLESLIAADGSTAMSCEVSC